MKPERCIEAGESLFLLPGEVWFGSGAGVLQTILGSCVAITAWHPAARLGGMCHFLLPSRPGGAHPANLDGRYGDEAVQLLTRRALAAGCDIRECDIQLYGGGWMFSAVPDSSRASNSALEIPWRNVQQARLAACALGVEVRAEHTGGSGHRQIRMSLLDGSVRVLHTPLECHAGPTRSDESLDLSLCVHNIQLVTTGRQ
ncbi:MAG TPA: chemotaxis protein CheD [Steroidobacteraceae bacterium]|nr:chemotaxis protein CheD [Steroidobacteraceae bacterium]